MEPKLKILFLASDPSNEARLHLGKELQEIRNKLSKNTWFDLDDHQATTPNDVIETIMNYKPQIVHFSGHGLDTGEICFEDSNGKSKPIPPDALAKLFGLVKEHVKCVIINTCYSEKQARAIAQFIPFVIGTLNTITDNSAIKFSTGFYTALEQDLTPTSLTKAFQLGCIAIQIDGNASDEPILIYGAPEVRFAAEVDKAFMSISHTKGKVIDVLLKALTLKGLKLGLSMEQTQNIISNKLDSLTSQKENLEDYENSIREMFRDEFPLSEDSLNALKLLQEGLGLSEIEAQKIIEKTEQDPKIHTDYAYYDRGRGQFNLANYEKALDYFTIAIEKNAEYSAAFYERGYTYHNQKKFDLAIGDFTQAINHNQNWEVVSNLSLAYFTRGLSEYSIQPLTKQNVTAALNDWSKSIELNPNDHNAFHNRGLAYQFLRNFEKAITDFKKALDMDKTSTNKSKASIASSIVRCYAELGNQEEIEKWTRVGLDYLENNDANTTN